MRIIAIALLLVAGLGSEVAVRANQALPGDLLYGFKIGVNEQVASVLASSDTAKATFDINEATSRLNEAQALAAQGKLTPTVQTELTANFNDHVHSALVDIEKMNADKNEQGALNATSQLQSVLAAEVSGMTALSASGDVQTQSSLAPIITQTRLALDTASGS